MKKGITLVSLVLYVGLFFAFTVFAAALSTNFNYRILGEKAMIITNKDYLKLYANLIDSAKSSDSVDIISNNIVFSNNDIYEYNSEKKTIFKNSAPIIQNVEEMYFPNFEDVIVSVGINEGINTNNIDADKCIAVGVRLRKYNFDMSKDFVVAVGD